ncbi:MAG: LapA family protein [Pirellulaceae bacterium]
MNETGILQYVDSSMLLVAFACGVLMGALLCFWSYQEHELKRAERWSAQDKKRMQRKELEATIRKEIKAKEAGL